MPGPVRLLLIGFAAAVGSAAGCAAAAAAAAAPAAMTAAAALLEAQLAACWSRPSSALAPDNKLTLLLTVCPWREQRAGELHALVLLWCVTKSTWGDFNRSRDIAQES